MSLHGDSLFDRSIYIAQTARAARIGNLAPAFPRLYTLCDDLRNIGCPFRANVIPDGFSVKVKAVAEGDRVLCFFYAHANGELILGNEMIPQCRDVDRVTIGRVTEIIGLWC